jgi:hypothetical protein
VAFSYPPEFMESLGSLGLAPTAETTPVTVRDALNDLYRYELRALRDRLRQGEFERSSYLERVVALRKKYWLLTLPLDAWNRICGVP